jgi:membrane protease YdiL (CAAX protease family)
MSGKHKTLALSWLAIAISSDLADIAWTLHSGHPLPVVAGLVKAILLVPLALIAREYVRTFVVTLIAFSCGNWLQRTIAQHWGWLQHASVSDRVYAFAWLGFIPSALIALTLVVDHLKPAEIFLTPGHLNARVAGLGKVCWTFLAPAIICFLIFGLTEQLRYLLGNKHAATHPSWLAIAALALSFAMINAANEEFRFRFVLLARGRRAVGSSAALWMTSLNFGLAHYVSGHPGGPTGFLTTTLFAMLLCRSLYDTEGGLWAWLIHIAGDVIIMVVVLLGGG